MIRLLKYDWKRNGRAVLALITVLVLLQGVMLTLNSLGYWKDEVTLVLSMVAYAMTGVILQIIVFKTFDHNIRSYSRRLLPVPVSSGMISTVVQSWMALIFIVLLISAHVLVLWSENWQALMQVGVLHWLDWTLMILALLWQFTSFVVTVLFCVTVARVFSAKGGLWLGIALSIAIPSVVSWLGDRIEGEPNAWTNKIFVLQIGVQESAASPVRPITEIPWGPLLLELIVVAVLVYVTKKLIERKVEVS
ncbi:hypothetical protein ACH6EH_17140 [Paenibacillus sp. JSM ZJ436]|uniref:hypothetical protein n=1 Tax=Paenibacillus sp. JSM ZJ436 TaxID=3376190 RepID=UPI0037B37107